MVWGAVAAIGGSLISGLFGSKKKKTTSEVDYVALKNNAEAAGFNPLTALRAGGAAGHTTTSHPALSAGEIFGNAISAAGQAYQNYDPLKTERAQAEYELLRAQLGNVQAQTKAIGSRRSQSFSVPVTGASQVVAGTGVSGLPLSPTEGERTITNPWQEAVVDNETSDGAVFEERYGDFVGGVLGLVPAARDAWKNYQRSVDRSLNSPEHKKWRDALDAKQSAADKRKAEAEARREKLRREQRRNMESLGFSSSW